MTLVRLKQLLAGAGLVIGLLGIVAVLASGAVVVVRAGTGADPSDAFTPTDLIPESLRGRVVWLDDEPDLARAMEPTTRRAIEAAWLRAAATDELAATLAVNAVEHDLRIEFYSLDGQVVGLTATTMVVRELGGRSVLMTESSEAVVILTDGRWEREHLVRTGAEVSETHDDPAS